MKHLQDLKTPVNKLANTLRLTGILLLVVAGVGFISYRSDTGNFWDIYTLFLVTLSVAGAVMAFIGETLWKILQTNSDVTYRRFYFYGEE